MEVLCDVGSITGVAVVGCSAGGWRVEKCSTEVQHVGTVAVGKQAIVPNAVEAVRQGVHQKAPDELASLERHRFALAVLAIILPAEADFAVGQRDQSAVGNGDAMGVAGKIGEHLLGAGEWTLSKYDPFALKQRREICREGVRILQTARVGAREQEVLRTGAPPIGAKNAEQLLGQHDIAILPALAAADVDHHPGACLLYTSPSPRDRTRSR